MRARSNLYAIGIFLYTISKNDVISLVQKLNYALRLGSM